MSEGADMENDGKIAGYVYRSLYLGGAWIWSPRPPSRGESMGEVDVVRRRDGFGVPLQLLAEPQPYRMANMRTFPDCQDQDLIKFEAGVVCRTKDHSGNLLDVPVYEIGLTVNGTQFTMPREWVPELASALLGYAEQAEKQEKVQ